MITAPVALCLFCGQRDEPDHPCDGRQGWREWADTLPPLMSGLVPATLGTSAAAADQVEDTRDSQRARVYEFIEASAEIGRTDDEQQAALGLDGSSQRPRRWELWKLGQIDILRDPAGSPVKRLTRTHRSAVVWVTSRYVRQRQSA